MGETSTKAQKVASWFLASPIRLMIVPYAVGIVWHGLHPVSSILTGDMKRPRRVYIDENSLETAHFNMNGASYDLIQQTKYDRKKYGILAESESADAIESLCHGIRTLHSNGASSFVDCHRYHSIHHEISFEVAKIQPSSAGFLPGNEAIVLVVPAFEAFSAARFRINTEVPVKVNKSRWQFQASILQLIRRLSSQQTSPWLARSILVVSPVSTSNAPGNTSNSSQTSMSPMLERTVESFLDVYLGKFHLNRYKRSNMDERMPIDYTGAIVRQLIVLDLEVFAADDFVPPLNSTKAVAPEFGELRILPQGRRGILPNMDLTAMALAVYDRSSAMLGGQLLDPVVRQRYKLVSMTLHPHHKKVESWVTWLREMCLPSQIQDWTYKMLHLLAFEYSMAVGPYPPHAPALERGIDSLTIQGVFPYATDEDDYDLDKGNMPRSKLSPQQYPLELVQKMEYIVRALSNLHERLHHSTSLYLLSSPDRFIKHEEYLIPALLLITPLIIRPLFILFRRDNYLGCSFRLDYTAARQAISVCILWTTTFSLLATDKASALIGTQGKRLVECSFEWTEKLRSFICSSFTPDPKEWYWATVYTAVESWKGWVIWQNFPFSMMEGSTSYDNQLCLLYTLSVLALVLSHQKFSALHLGDYNSKQSIQCLTCLLAAFLHIAIAFGHSSMAFASALLWTPFLAFQSQNCRDGRSKTYSRFAIKIFLFMVSCPFTFFPPQVYPTRFTLYCRYVYLPLHFLFSLLLLTESKAKVEQ